MEHVIHEIPPLFSPSSSILILGSFPSVKSRECGFFYGHPQNRFWKVLSSLFRELGQNTPVEYDYRGLQNRTPLETLFGVKYALCAPDSTGFMAPSSGGRPGTFLWFSSICCPTTGRGCMQSYSLWGYWPSLPFAMCWGLRSPPPSAASCFWQTPLTSNPFPRPYPMSATG